MIDRRTDGRSGSRPFNSWWPFKHWSASYWPRTVNQRTALSSETKVNPMLAHPRDWVKTGFKTGVAVSNGFRLRLRNCDHYIALQRPPSLHAIDAALIQRR